MTTAEPGIWHFITGEYPPDLGGVADYTAFVAAELVVAGAEVHVWAPGDTQGPVVETGGVIVHRIAGRFGPADLGRLGRELDQFPGPRTLFIQYVPHSFGWKAMNLGFATWALGRRIRRRDDVRILFHEVSFPWVRRPLRHNIIAVAHRMMAAIMARAASRAYITTEAWGPRLRRLGSGRLPIIWAPIPSSIPHGEADATVAARRAELTRGEPATRVVCHFGTYGPSVTRTLGPVVRDLLAGHPQIRVLLLGAGGERWRDEMAPDLAATDERVVAPGPLSGPVVSEFLRACDLAVQPYPDGASGRRSSLMAALANGVPVATTIGELSESIWRDGAVAVAPADDPARLTRLALDLLDCPERLAELGRAGRRLYEDRFAIRHTVATLLGPP